MKPLSLIFGIATEIYSKMWAEWEIENKDNLLVPDETLLDPRLQKAIKDAWENPEKENAVADLWEEIIMVFMLRSFLTLNA
ncbi:hypothetical protein [Zobellia laminariae]|uniref:hypothetical protein n=1 Tax=Zobellia laminariae TaxID=248906 RepID=UPI0026F45142|nr:hypothetical protein [Zobellia laminariae]WKX75978.1 hypothetical protein Q5W13_20700 [Zobellia laminariae]